MCRALIGFFDTNTEEKMKKYLGGSEVMRMVENMHSAFMNEKFAGADDIGGLGELFMSFLLGKTNQSKTEKPEKFSSPLPDYIVNRYKRICQIAQLAWIEAQHPELFEHLKVEAEYISEVLSGKKPDPWKSILKHKECPFCTGRRSRLRKFAPWNKKYDVPLIEPNLSEG